MSKVPSQKILDDTELISELLQFEERFREVTRIEFLEYDMETLRSKAERGHSQESSGFSIMDTVASIVRDEAVKILWSKYGKSIGA